MITAGFRFDLKNLQVTEGFPEAARKMLQSQEGRLDRLSAQQREELTKMRGWTSQSYGMLAGWGAGRVSPRVWPLRTLFGN